MPASPTSVQFGALSVMSLVGAAAQNLIRSVWVQDDASIFRRAGSFVVGAKVWTNGATVDTQDSVRQFHSMDRCWSLFLHQLSAVRSESGCMIQL